MKSPLRIAAAAAAAVLTVGIAAPAIAAGHEVSGDLGTHSRGHVTGKKQVLSLIKVADSTLARISESGQVTNLSPENLSVVLNHVSADRAALTKLKKRAQRATRPATLTKVQTKLRNFHAQSYIAIAYLLGDSDDLLWIVDQDRQNLADDDTFSPQERASLNAQLDAVEARVKAAGASSRGLAARSDQTEIRNLEDALLKAGDDIEDLDTTIYNGGDNG
jgi:hypothetical protein